MSRVYEVVTRTKFEHIQRIEASSLEEAIEKSKTSLDFMQKLIKEQVVDAHVCNLDQEDWLERKHKQGYI